jgi:membrane-bound inhibitor of C-type lysozyme
MVVARTSVDQFVLAHLDYVSYQCESRPITVQQGNEPKLRAKWLRLLVRHLLQP